MSVAPPLLQSAAWMDLMCQNFNFARVPTTSYHTVSRQTATDSISHSILHYNTCLPGTTYSEAAGKESPVLPPAPPCASAAAAAAAVAPSSAPAPAPAPASLIVSVCWALPAGVLDSSTSRSPFLALSTSSCVLKMLRMKGRTSPAKNNQYSYKRGGY